MQIRAVVIALTCLLSACGSKKEPPPANDPPKTEPPKTEPPKTEPPKTEPPKTEGSGSSAAGSGSADAGSGSNVAAGSGSGSAAAGSGSGSGAEEKHWFDSLSHDEKMDYMKKTVVPTLKPMFQKFDAKEFANFGCKTCHGKDPQKSKYKMPSPDVAALDFAALKAGKQKPEMAKWMGEVVKPEMAKLLKEAEYTESNPKGFGCLGCHEMKK